jgi:hypothetical protein
MLSLVCIDPSPGDPSMQNLRCAVAHTRAIVVCVPRGPRVLSVSANQNKAALPAFHFLARIADGGVASTPGVCVHSAIS